MTGSDRPGVFVPPLLFAAAVAAGVLIDGNRLDWPNVTHPSQVADLAVTLAGFPLIGLSLGVFRRFRTRGEP